MPLKVTHNLMCLRKPGLSNIIQIVPTLRENLRIFVFLLLYHLPTFLVIILQGLKAPT